MSVGARPARLSGCTEGGRIAEALNATRRAEARLARNVLVPIGYQLPPVGQAPEPAVEQVRVGAPPSTFVMLKVLPDFEWPLMT